jgi:hypothetical protein
LRLDPPWRISKIEFRKTKVASRSTAHGTTARSTRFWRNLSSQVQSAKAKAQGYGTFKNLKPIIYMLTVKLNYSKVSLPT